MTRLAIAIDLSRCTGCNTCAMACKMQNNVPMGMTWNRVLNENCEFEVGVQGTYPSISRSHLPIACQHCENPACLRVCPTGATYKDDKGRVEIDYEKCIACGLCLAACPYGARKLNRTSENMFGADVPAPYESYGVQRELVAEKCIFCEARLAEGKQPACVVNCPGRARYFGDLDDPESPVSKFIAGDEAVLRVDETSFYYRPVDGMPLDVLPSNALASSKKGR